MISVFSASLVDVLNMPLAQMTTITAIVLLIVVGLLIIPVCGLFGFHLVLIFKGRTTNEQVTGKYKGLDLFNNGCWKNFENVLCSSFTPKFSYKTRRKYFYKTSHDAKYKAGLENVMIT
jgi:hypothetical protein